MTQINTPYPATAYLAGYFRAQGYDVAQADLGLELILDLFSATGLDLIKQSLHTKSNSDSVSFFLQVFTDYGSTIDSVIRFLQGKDPSLALRIAERKLLPEGPRFLPLQEHQESILSLFGDLGIQDKAKYIASLYLDDLSDVVRDGIDPDFGFSRYAESLASSQASFDPLYKKLNSKISIIDQRVEFLVEKYMQKEKPDLVGLTVPFPGNLYSALQIGKYIKKHFSHIPIAMGGGFVNTELRNLSDKRFFEFADYLIFDEGELSLKNILQKQPLLRTKHLVDGVVHDSNFSNSQNIKRTEHPGPSYVGLPLDKYVSMLEMPNHLHRLWSDFRWNKLMLAHGCYWKKCSFCDVSLDYISRYEPNKVSDLIQQIQRVMQETGSSGFHFVDEAAPPGLLRALAKELLQKNIKISWWGNLRFDPQFDSELCQLMADAGCVAVTGGLEVASDRVLKLINKGIDLAQVAKVTKNFSDAGIYVHAYLMYGFPTQTEQETVDSLEVVRQLFQAGCLHSAHWHRFVATAHSPVGKNPQEYSIKLKQHNTSFANYSVDYNEKNSVDHEILGKGLRRALYNYMHKQHLSLPVHEWFPKKVKKTTLSKAFIKKFFQD